MLLAAPLAGAASPASAVDLRSPAPAAGGAALVRAVESGPTLVVGTIADPRALDEHGWTARIQVEQTLSGATQAGSTLEIGWEELAKSRPPRFTAGGRALVALGPLPQSSLWHARFPAGGALAVQGDGEAFLRDPDPATISALERWSKLGASEREANAGVWALAALWASAEPSVAEGALARLAEIPGLDGKVYGDAAATLATGLASSARPLPLREALLRLAGERRLGALQPAIEELGQRGDPLEAPALDALATISGGLPEERVRGLLSRHEAAVRAVGVRWARGPLVGSLAPMVKGDPSPEVRAAALIALVDQQEMAAFDVAAQGLFDPDPAVRAVAAKRIGALGAPAVPGLVALVEARSMPEAGAPIAALVFTGGAGRAAVGSIAESHSDPRVRSAARMALGKLASEK